MNRPLVSILIVTYNAEKYIEATLQSCLNQSYQSFEILILDNGSIDRTIEKITAFRDPRISLRRNANNVGPYHGLNALLEVARGEFIAIQDHDDVWLPTKIEQQVNFLTNRPDYVACGTLTYYFFEDRQVVVRPPKPPIADFVDHTSLVFRAGPMRYDPTRALPDEYFERKTLRAIGLIACLQTGLTVHRIRADRHNLSTKRSERNWRGAWEHWQLTGYRDVVGTLVFVITSFVPSGLRWWLRRRVTLRRATWLGQKEFSARNNIIL